MKVLYKVGQFAYKHLPEILTGLSIIGVTYVAISSAKASKKAEELKKEAEELKGEPLTKKEEIFAAAPAYVKPAVGVIITAGCIIGSNSFNRKQQVSLAATAIAMEKAYKQFKSKAIEKYGEDFEEVVKKAIADGGVKDAEPAKDGEELYYDESLREWYYADPKDVIIAHFSVKEKLDDDGECTLSDYREYLGLDWKPENDGIGWDIDSVIYCCSERNLRFDIVDETTSDGVSYKRIVPLIEPSPNYEFYAPWEEAYAHRLPFNDNYCNEECVNPAQIEENRKDEVK